MVDPGIVTIEPGVQGPVTYYVVGTSDYETGMDVHASENRLNWRTVGKAFPPPTQPAWVDDRQTSFVSPQIYPMSDGRFLLLYAAYAKGKEFHCLGAAISATPFNFTDVGAPILCTPGDDHSVMDPSLFNDPVSGQQFLMYKDAVPGDNRIAIRQIVGTIGANATVGGAHYLHRTPKPADEPKGWEGDTVEAPTMVLKDGFYYLFYSGGAFDHDSYAVGVARSASPTGPFEKFAGNPILRGVGSEFCGVGSQDITNTGRDGWNIWYSAWSHMSRISDKCVDVKGEPKGRHLMVDEIWWDAGDGWPRVNDGLPSETAN